MTKAHTESSPFAPFKRRVLRMIPPSSLLYELAGTLRDFRSTRSSRVDSSIHFSAFAHEQAVRSHTEVEIRKAQAIDWYLRQKGKMM
ncbi:MAG: hypothetical protein OEZ25_06515 [Candidatus Bathyarchaeota archaeon]|nr:hypothetical protein [Candidatus Bathyarchaeota archaeon]